MRKTLLIAAGILPLLASCSGNKQKDTVAADTDSAFIQEAEAAIDSIAMPMLTEQGLGAIRIGMPLDSVPEGIDNLYDRIVSDGTPDAMVYSFYMGTEPMFDIYTFDEKSVDMISLNSPTIGARADKGVLHIGDPMSSLLSQPGITTEYAAMDDSGLWYWKDAGLWYSPDPEKCSPKLIEAMSERRTPPAASLIPADLTIGFIATGLPF